MNATNSPSASLFSWQFKKNWTPWLFLLPWVISLIIFWYGPILYTATLSFMKYNLIRGGYFNGIDNYIKIFNDRMFWKSLGNTFWFIALYLPFNAGIGLALALLIKEKIVFRGLWRVAFYLPAVLPLVAVFVLGKFIFFPDGLMNMLVSALGGEEVLWLASPTWIIPASVILMAWQCGNAMVIYLAGLQAIPSSYYDAARIDGAGVLGRFWNVTLPLLAPTIVFRLIVDLIFGMMIFLPGLILPEGMVFGGPAHASRFFALHLYDKAFLRFVLGEASALATILMVICLVLTLFIIRWSEKRTHYEM